jgi:hypothetical protein
MYGTTPCPQIIKTTLDGGTRTDETCPETSDVVDNGEGSYTATCPHGHVHSFGDYYLTNVTPV